MSTHIWWIRRDLRLQDNPALTAALQGAQTLLPLFILEPEMLSKAAPKRRAFLLNALADLDDQLRRLGSRLTLRKGPARDALPALVAELGGARVFAQQDFSPLARQRDEVLDLTPTEGEVLRHPRRNPQSRWQRLCRLHPLQAEMVRTPPAHPGGPPPRARNLTAPAGEPDL